MSKRFTIHAIRIRFSLVLLIILLMQPVVYSQLTISIDEQIQCENSEILVPVLVSELNNVGSIQLYIEINAQDLDFEAVVNPHSNLSGGNLSASFSNSGDERIVVTWWRSSPVTINSGKLFDLKLFYKEGETSLNFSDDCEIALSDLTVLDNVVYNNGLIEPVLIEIITQPQDQTVEEDDTAQFTIEQNGADAYQWQYNSGNGWSNLSDDLFYNGVTTYELNIINVPLDLNNYMFRCILSVDDCSLTSDEVTLLVTPLGTGMFSDRLPGLKVYPNPFNSSLSYSLDIPVNNYSLQLVSLLGKVVHHSRNSDVNQTGTGIIQTNDLPPGFYFLQLLSDDKVLVTVKVLKQ